MTEVYRVRKEDGFAPFRIFNVSNPKSIERWKAMCKNSSVYSMKKIK